MRAHVPSQGAGVFTGLHTTQVHVSSQTAGLRERLAARLTDMRLLPRMRAHVQSQLEWL